MTLETKSLDSQSEVSIVSSESSFSKSSSLDKNKKWHKKSPNMPQNIEEQLPNKRRHTHASKRAQQRKGFTDY